MLVCVRRSAEGERVERRLWQARNKKKIEWKHLRNCANYVGVGVQDALALYNKAFVGGGEFVLIAMSAEQEINQILSVYELARVSVTR